MRKHSKASFWFHAIVVAMLAVALWLEYSPYLLHWDELGRIQRHTTRLKPGALALLLQNDEKKPTLLFLYASWCANCSQPGRMLHDMEKSGRLDGVNVIFLSLDDNPVEMARYMIVHDYGDMKPYILDPDSPQTLEYTLRLRGSLFNGGIPYEGVFDEKGNIAGEASGSLDEAQAGELLASIRRSAKP